MKGEREQEDAEMESREGDAGMGRWRRVNVAEKCRARGGEAIWGVREERGGEGGVERGARKGGREWGGGGEEGNVMKGWGGGREVVRAKREGVGDCGGETWSDGLRMEGDEEGRGSTGRWWARREGGLRGGGRTGERGT